MTLPPSMSWREIVQGQPIEYFSAPDSLLSRPSLFQYQTFTPLQAQVDGLVGGFVQQATDGRSLVAMMAGGMAYRLGRTGVMATGAGRLASLGIGLGAEVTAFEMTNRSLSSLTGDTHFNPNLWRWDGQGGIRQGLLSSLVTFGTLKGAGRLAQGENVVVQHLLQDTGMVLGHQVSGAFGITPRPTGSLAEQFLHAEVTNLQLSGGMALAHSFAPGLQGIERGLDLSLRTTETETSGPQSVFGQLALATAGGRTARPSASQNSKESTILQMSANGGDGNGDGRDGELPSSGLMASPPSDHNSGQEPAREALSPDEVSTLPPPGDASLSTGSGQFSASFGDLVRSPAFGDLVRETFPMSQPPALLATEILRPSPHVTYSEVRQDGESHEIEFRVSSLGAAAYGNVTDNTFLSRRGILPPEMTFVGRHPLIARVIQEVLDKSPGAQVIHGVERVEYGSLPHLGDQVLSRSTVRTRGSTVILSHELFDGNNKSVGSGRTILAIVPTGTPLPEPPVKDPSSLGEPIMIYTVPEDLPEHYSEVSGDHNPVHKGPDRILHGMATLNLAHAAYRQTQDPEDPVRPFILEAKFSGAVRPGDTLRFFLEKGEKTNSVLVLNERNQLALTLVVKEAAESPPETPTPQAVRGATLDGAQSGVLPVGTQVDSTTRIESPLSISDASTFQMMETILRQVGLVGQSLNYPELMMAALRLSTGSRVEGRVIDYVRDSLEQARSSIQVNVDEISGRVMDLARAKETRTIEISRRNIIADPIAGAEAVVNGLRQMDPALLSETARLASTSEVSRQTNILLGSSDGYGFLTYTAALATNAFRYGIANFFVDPRIVRGSTEAPKYASRQFSNIYGLEILAEAMDARLESINDSTILTPFKKPVVNPLSQEYLGAVGRIRPQAPIQAINLINSIAWAPYMGSAPGGVQLRRVPDINENGQVFLTETKEFDQADYEGTLRTMGLNHLALLAAHQPFFGPETKTIGYTWTGGSQRIWTMAGSYGRATLGNSKMLMELSALLMHLNSLQNGGSYGAHLIAELPYAKTAASSQIAAAPGLGHFQQEVLRRNNALRSTPNLALDVINRFVSGQLNLGNPRTSIVLDSHEKLHSPEISTDHLAFIGRVAQYAQEHPEWDGGPLPVEISQKLIKGN